MLVDAMDKIHDGNGTQHELQEMSRLNQVLSMSAHCGLGHTACNPILATMKRFRPAYERKLRSLDFAPAFDLDGARITDTLCLIDDVLANDAAMLMARVEAGRVVEGHGDLRPEHVCLNTPPVIIDCLEFNRELRLVDPVDELMFLGLECKRLGDGWIGATLFERYSARLGDTPPTALLDFYWRYRACLRARLSLVHILERDTRDPGKWLPLAGQYLALAETPEINSPL
jgi:aminoglycoside phosphotransferase family enzyme